MARRISEIGGTKLEPVELTIDSVKRIFDISDPKLPKWVEDNAMSSGGYPYEGKLDRKQYDTVLEDLQEELVKLQDWLGKSANKVMILFEGRDAAGKGGAIAAFRQFLNPRVARNVALAKPTETERAQWYFQRYASQFPAAGEFVTFDRSWYNRAGVEPVMGFCTSAQYKKFMDDVPDFERMIVDEGFHFFKIYLEIGQEMQIKRFHDRVHSRLKHWKFSPVDIAGMTKWDDYTKYRDAMLQKTSPDFAPWTVIRANDKRRARIEAIKRVLGSIDYAAKNSKVIGKPDPAIAMNPKAFGASLKTR